MPRVMIYGRISIDKENIENQEIALLKFVEQQGWSLAAPPYRETEHGDVGEIWNNGELMIRRPGLLKLKEMAKEHKFDILLIWHDDRLSREGGVTLTNYVRMFESLAVRVYDYQKKDYLTIGKESTGELVQVAQAVGSKAYLEAVRMKTQQALDNKKMQIVEQGYFISKAGKTITSLGRPKLRVGGKNGMPKRDLTDADIKRIKDLSNLGYSLRQIAAEFNCSTGPIIKILKM